MNTETNTKKENIFSSPIVKSLSGIAVAVLLLGGFIFWQNSYGTVYIENSQIDAPIINLSPNTAGTLNALYVKEGDTINENAPVALVGTNLVSSKQSGVVISVSNKIGTYFQPGVSVVSMIHTEDMRVVGEVDETKGLEQIKVGQKVMFSVDAFSGKTYVGIVDSVGQTANDTGAVFSISDKRPIKKFDVKVRFNVSDYPELKNGMSAKITIYVK